jgi:DNA/RNA-binding domain of Phe-tRNA-synthetase-like protein
MRVSIEIASHPLLEAGAFVTRFPQPLGELAPLELDLQPATSDAVKTAVRDLLRQGGFKPAGRSKPASEYLAGALAEFPRINAAVDACNEASLRFGLPISVVDLDRAVAPFRIAVAPAGTSYVFNPSGQTIDASGLLCLFDAEGPSGTPVKDAQRTKTHPGTRAVLSIVWGTKALPGLTGSTTAWYRARAAERGAVEDVGIQL